MFVEPLSGRNGPSFLSIGEDPWVAAPCTSMDESLPEFPSAVEALRRVQSSSAITFKMPSEGTGGLQTNWPMASANSGPLPIRITRRTAPEDISSLESSQSLLLGCNPSSFSDDSAIMHTLSQAHSAQRYEFNSHHHNHQDHHHHSFGGGFTGPATAPARITAPGGHWAWIPASPSNPVPPLSTAIPCTMIPVNAGPLPLPIPIPSSSLFADQHHDHHNHLHHLAQPTSTGSGGSAGHVSGGSAGNVPEMELDMDLDLDLLDSFDVMEMADSLGSREIAVAVGKSWSMGHRRAVGSCPLPTLLEDALSAERDDDDDVDEDEDEEDGSDDTNTMRRSTLNTSHSFEAMDRAGSGTLTSLRSRAPGGGGGGATATTATTTTTTTTRSGGMPIPGARSAPLKVQQRTQRSASVPQFSSMLASSLPSSMTSDRPMRSAARRSLAVTAAALHEATEDSDSETSEGGLPSSSWGAASRRSNGGNNSALRSGMHHHHHHFHHSGGGSGGGGSGSGSSHSSNKKKHNPWTMEETLALVEGVRITGVGKWAEIKRAQVVGVADILETRTPVDLKDKWRNLTRVARLPKTVLRQRLLRGPSDIPLETMLMVKHLMEVGQDAE